jgi:hypothetical protein
VHHGARLKISNVVRCVVHELRVPDAALVRLLKALELHLEEVEPFHVGHDRRLPCLMRGFEFVRGHGAAHAMIGDHLVHPGEALEMVPIELSRLGGAHRSQNALRIPAEDRAVGHIGEACDGERSRPHGVREIVVRRRCRRDPRLTAMRMNVDGDRFAQHSERSSGCIGHLGGGCRTTRSNLAGEHRID